MAAYDGSIRIDTKIDSTGFNKGVKSIGAGVDGITSSLKSLAATIGAAFGIGTIINFGKASIKASTDLSNAMLGLRSIVQGQGRDFQSAQAFLQKYISDGLIPATNAVTAYKNLAMRGYTDPQIQSTLTALKDSAAFGRQASLTLGEAVSSATEGLKNENSILVDNAGVTKNVSVMWKDYAASIGVGVQSLTKQQRIQAEVTGIMQETRFQTGDAAKLTNTYSGEVLQLGYNFNNLKIAVGNALIPIAQAVLPGLNSIINALTRVANLFAQVSTAIFGKQAAQNKAVASTATSAAAAQNKLADATKKAGKAADNNVASWDKLNVLQQDMSTTTADQSIPDVSTSASPASDSDNTLTDKVKASLSDIYSILIASSAMLVIGTILAFSGHPVIGISLMLAGAAGLAASAALEWGSLEGPLKKQISKLQAIVGGALLVIGAILAFSGVALPLGIGLMLAGAINLATAVAINWNSMSPNISGELSVILGMLSGAFLVLGAIFAFSGANIPLGIALMAIGAISLAAAVAINWHSSDNHVADAVNTIAGIVGGALLAVGAMLAFTGVNLPLGIALIAAGSVALATVVALNWDSINSPISQTISKITAIVGGALLALGAILAFSGVNPVLGIALISAGAVTLAATVALNWNNMNDSTRAVITTVTAIVGVAFLALGAILALSGGNIPLGIALMALGATSLATSAILNWENIVTTLQGPVGEIAAIVGGALLVLGAILAFSGVALPLGIALMAAGAISLVTVTALNWDAVHSAMQGPVGVITALAGASLLALGLILCLSGVGIPLGIGLLIAGGATLATAIAPNWNAIPDKIKSVWNSIKDIINNDIISGVESFINFIIGGFNKLISYLNGLNIKAPDWVTKLTGIESFGFNITPFNNVSIPRLAQGAVIPPNRQFMAVLGDQTSGTNIETPLDTMIGAFKAALSDMGATQSTTPQINIIASGNDAGLVRWMKFEIEQDNRRVGPVMATGGGR